MRDEICFVTGTGTGVGKTWVTCALIAQARARGTRVAARKPVQSFEPGATSTDADLLAAASGSDRYEVCPRPHWYAAEAAPPIAAEMLGRRVPTATEIVAALDLPDSDLVFVEGVGGPRSPVAADADNVTLARMIGATSILLVSPAGLGSINATLASAAAYEAAPIVFLNRFDPGNRVHRLDAAWLEDHSDLELFTELDAVLDRLIERERLVTEPLVPSR